MNLILSAERTIFQPHKLCATWHGKISSIQAIESPWLHIVQYTHDIKLWDRSKSDRDQGCTTTCAGQKTTADNSFTDKS